MFNCFCCFRRSRYDSLDDDTELNERTFLVKKIDRPALAIKRLIVIPYQGVISQDAAAINCQDTFESSFTNSLVLFSDESLDESFSSARVTFSDGSSNSMLVSSTTRKTIEKNQIVVEQVLRITPVGASNPINFTEDEPKQSNDFSQPAMNSRPFEIYNCSNGTNTNTNTGQTKNENE